MSASGDESETFLPFGIVHQLLGTSDHSWEDPFAAGAAVLEDLDRLGDRQATAIIVDDAHLADAASLGALTFALRRLAGRPGAGDLRDPGRPGLAAAAGPAPAGRR